MKSSVGRSYHASAPYCSKTAAALFDERGRDDRLAALRAVDGGNRHAPDALARDAPVGAVRDHVVHAVVAPRRDPLDLVVDRVERRLAQRRLPAVDAPASPIEVDEPLRRREEDHRVVAAPAVRILVRERLAVPQPAALLQRLVHLRVGVEHALAAEQLHGVEEMPGRSDRRVDLEAVLHAGVEVVRAVPGRRVHGAGARFERHVLAEHAERRARVERVLEADVLELRALHPRDRRAERLARRPPRPSAQALRRRSPARPSTSYAA